MEFGELSFRNAMEALNDQIKRQVTESGYRAQLPESLRKELIAFAERNFDARTTDRESTNRLVVQRLAARNIAGSLALIDGKDAPSPFKHRELTRIYQEEQAYRSALEKSLQRGNDRGLDR